MAPTPQRGFGADALPQTASAREALPQREQLRITAMRELRPRTFALTLADGGQWEFTDEAPLAYDPPRVGAAVELRRGALGSFMLEYAGQPSIRVKRVR
ncbi:MAG: hypothetical protein B7Z08_12510 [Sphingomonadales bacterium 32-68-7]|nr:MAG: hypothetical protein B7Z33_12885 [Sphingomonadales bacterium 12-68-11]OYX07340.1 MAG: hypothetical protein B7Z08_12510 [Sphingomonadales bacterium 32-68-7]